MGKNKKNRQKQQKSPQPNRQLPIITATTAIDDESETSNRVEQLTIQAPAIFVDTVCSFSLYSHKIFYFYSQLKNTMETKMETKTKRKIGLNKYSKKSKDVKLL